MTPPPVTAEDLLRHRTWVRGLARTLVRDEASLDDLEQETWVAALESPPRDADAGRSWLGRVVRNRATDLFRARRRRDLREAATARSEGVPSAAETVARAEAHRLVVDAVMALDEQQRDAVLLRYFEDLPPREVARRLGVPVETARTRIKRGLATLRERLAAGDDRKRGGRGSYGALLLLAGEQGGPGGPGAPVGKVTGTAAKAAAGAGLVGIAVKWIVAACAVAAIAGGAVYLRGDGARVAPVAPPAPNEDGTGSSAGGAAPRDAAPRARRPGEPETAETTAAAAPPGEPAPAAKRSVRLVHADGRAAADAGVVVCDAEKVDHRGRTDSEGRFDVKPSAADRALLVQIAGDAARRLVLPAGAEPCDVVVPAGLAISGTVIVDDAPPPQPFTITFAAHGSVFPLTGLAAEAHEIVESGGPDPYSPELRVAADGSFRVGGLTSEARGELLPPDGWNPTEGLPAVAAGDEGIVFRLRALPAFTGRVVDAAGKPVAGASIEYEWDDGNDESGGGARDGGEDGRFRVVLDNPGVPALKLRVVDADGLASSALTFEGPFDGVRDLGDVRLPDPWAAKMEIIVRDPAGKPVEGALAAIGDKSPWISPPSGADGRMTLPAKTSAASAILVAPGRKYTDVAIVPTAKDAPAVVVLAPCAMLRVKADLGGAPRTGAVLVVSGSSRVFDEPIGEAVYSLREPLGATHASASYRSTGEGGESSTFRLEDADPTVVPWLFPGTEITLELRDAYGSKIAHATVKLAEGEQRETTLRATAKALDVVVRVRDAAGRPVPGAHIVARAAELDEDDALEYGQSPAGVKSSDADGTATFTGVHGRAFALFVRADGHGAWFRRRIDLAETSPAIDVSLPAERIVRVRLKSSSKMPVYFTLDAVPSDPAFWMPGFQPFPAIRGDDGVLAIRGLPPGDATLRIVADAAMAEIAAPAGRDAIDAEMPEAKEKR